jgi:hypothetical protein
MATFIFVSGEGYTYLPGSESIEPDVENLQVLGFATGVDEQDAFANLIAEQPSLLSTGFDEAKCFELRREDYEQHARVYSLLNAAGSLPNSPLRAPQDPQ